MSEKPYVPFYKPYGMSDEEYQHEVKLAESKLEEWEYDQYLQSLILDAEKEANIKE
jgi:hypothetical protein